MTRTSQFAVFFVIALIALTPLAVLAQSGDTVSLVPFTSQEMAFSGLAPDGWATSSAGTYRRMATEGDLTALIQQAAFGFTADDIVTALLPRLGQTALPDESTVVEAHGLNWTAYRISVDVPDLGTIVVDLALAESSQATDIVILQAMGDDYDALHEQVFMPVLQAFEPFSLNWGRADGPAPIPADFQPARLIAEVLDVRPHDPSAYTQGLLLYDGSLYESAGRYGESTLREVNPQTGEVLRSIDIPAEYFAEGLALVGDSLIQLTWQEGTAFVYDRATFEQTGSFTYDGEGWGLCYDGQYLYMSNGSPFIAIRDPETFDLIDHGVVTYRGQPADSLNELECVGDYLYANVYTTDIILQIDKTNGNVVAVIDASGLLDADQQDALASDEVLNGIVYLPDSDTFLITGKHWPSMFEVQFVEAPAE